MTQQPDITEDVQGVIRFVLPNGDLHREDGPALVRPDGGREWWQHGKHHREDGPAVVHADGTQVWMRHGKLHRVDGPAILKSNGTQEWYLNGMFHREDGPCRRRSDGFEEWRRRGALHRMDGPARTLSDGTRVWVVDDLLHREDGPAIVHVNGSEQWFVNGVLHRTDGPACDYHYRYYRAERIPQKNGNSETMLWCVNGHVVDVEERQSGTLQRAREKMAHVGFVLTEQEMADTVFLRLEENEDKFIRHFVYVKDNVDVSMLHHANQGIAAVAAWHLPFDDDYLAAAFANPVVADIMCHRADSDVPDHVKTLMDVVT